MKGGAETGDSGLAGRRVLINPNAMEPNPAITDAVWEKFLALPSQSLPQRAAKPVKRLTVLAHELAADRLREDAGKQAHAELPRVLDAARVRYGTQIGAARDTVLTVEGQTLTADMKRKQKSLNEFLEDADYAVIEAAFRRASRLLSADLARTYAEYLAARASDAEPDEDSLIEAHTTIASLGLVPEVKAYLDAEADKLAKALQSKYRVGIKALSDDRQEVYRQIKSMSTEPQDIDLARPKSWMEATTARETNGDETPLPRYPHHLLCDDDGSFPAELNEWEREVLNTEMSRPGFLGWYRNPSRASQDSLGVAYSDDKQVRIVRPDFLFFSEQADGSVAADIVDPHGFHFSDALPKLKGLAEYAATHAEDFRRIEAIAKIGDQLRVLDLTDADTRAAVAEAENTEALYQGDLTYHYSA